MSSANSLTDDPAAYTFTIKEVSPVADDPDNPDCIYFYRDLQPGTVRTVAQPKGQTRGETY